MKRRFLRKKWLLTFTVVIILLVASFWLVSLKLDYERENDAVLEYFSHQQGMPDAFAVLEQLTSQGSVVLCWWDYGRAVREWSHRNVIEACRSQDIWYIVGSSRTFLGNLKAQLFGIWGSSEKFMI